MLDDLPDLDASNLGEWCAAPFSSAVPCTATAPSTGSQIGWQNHSGAPISHKPARTQNLTGAQSRLLSGLPPWLQHKMSALGDLPTCDVLSGSAGKHYTGLGSFPGAMQTPPPQNQRINSAVQQEDALGHAPQLQSLGSIQNPFSSSEPCSNGPPKSIAIESCQGYEAQATSLAFNAGTMSETSTPHFEEHSGSGAHWGFLQCSQGHLPQDLERAMTLPIEWAAGKAHSGPSFQAPEKASDEPGLQMTTLPGPAAWRQASTSLQCETHFGCHAPADLQKAGSMCQGFAAGRSPERADNSIRQLQASPSKQESVSAHNSGHEASKVHSASKPREQEVAQESVVGSASVTAKRQQRGREHLERSRKVTLQLTPLDEETRAAMQQARLIPSLELVCRSKKEVSQVLSHLQYKWEAACPSAAWPKGPHALRLFPTAAMPVLAGASWGPPNLPASLTIADLQMAMGFPELLPLHYRWHHTNITTPCITTPAPKLLLGQAQFPEELQEPEALPEYQPATECAAGDCTLAAVSRPANFSAEAVADMSTDRGGSESFDERVFGDLTAVAEQQDNRRERPCSAARRLTLGSDAAAHALAETALDNIVFQAYGDQLEGSSVQTPVPFTSTYGGQLQHTEMTPLHSALLEKGSNVAASAPAKLCRTGNELMATRNSNPLAAQTRTAAKNGGVTWSKDQAKALQAPSAQKSPPPSATRGLAKKHGAKDENLAPEALKKRSRSGSSVLPTRERSDLKEADTGHEGSEDLQERRKRRPRAFKSCSQRPEGQQSQPGSDELEQELLGCLDADLPEQIHVTKRKRGNSSSKPAGQAKGRRRRGKAPGAGAGAKSEGSGVANVTPSAGHRPGHSRRAASPEQGHSTQMVVQQVFLADGAGAVTAKAEPSGDLRPCIAGNKPCDGLEAFKASEELKTCPGMEPAIEGQVSHNQQQWDADFLEWDFDSSLSNWASRTECKQAAYGPDGTMPDEEELAAFVAGLLDA